jgi:exonuclease SbcC
MRPRKLEMQAFGPYAKRETIDFAALGDRQLFLIHGPTGSGKTSILDAICYALYGETTGDERQGKSMRSDHVDAGTLTYVLFEFEIGKARYQVHRVPEQMRRNLEMHGVYAWLRFRFNPEEIGSLQFVLDLGNLGVAQFARTAQVRLLARIVRHPTIGVDDYFSHFRRCSTALPESNQCAFRKCKLLSLGRNRSRLESLWRGLSPFFVLV